MSLLTEEQFELVRDFYNGGASTAAISHTIGAPVYEVRATIAARNYHQYSTKSVSSYLIDAKPYQPKRIPDKVIQRIWQLRGSMTHEAIARQVGVSLSFVDKIFAGILHPHLHPNYEANKGENRPTD